MTARLPAGVEPYKRTPTFTEETVPAGLLKDHSTKEGTWGLIYVEEGALLYRVTDPRRVPSQQELTADRAPGLVEPTVLHYVVPLGPVRFHVQFLRERAVGDQ